MGSDSHSARQAPRGAGTPRRTAVIAWVLGSLLGLGVMLIVAVSVIGW
jgi:hypothetical protein